MGQEENQIESSHSSSSEAAGDILQSVTQDLKALQQNIVSQLGQDVTRLQREKDRLQNEVDRLQEEQQMLQANQQALLSRQQLAQQQLWAKQLAQALANHLQTILVQRLNPPAQPGAIVGQPGSALSTALRTANREQTDQIIASLDTTLTQTLRTIRQDLNSYESSLSQQLNRMHTLEQQGEAILEALVHRLSLELQAEAVRVPPPGVVNGTAYLPGASATNQAMARSTAQPAVNQAIATGSASPNGSYGATTSRSASQPVNQPISQSAGQSAGQPANRQPTHPPSQSYAASSASGAVGGSTAPGTAPSAAIAPDPQTSPAARPRSQVTLSSFQLGFLLILLSTVALSLHNVVVQIIGRPSSIFGIFNLGGFIDLRNLGNSLLILWLRMIIVVPIMLLIARTLYPSTARDVRQFLEANDRRLLRSVVGSGFFLFLSQVLIYIAISQVGPGVAVTILFMYPILTVPLAWFLFGDRPTRLRLIVMVAILTGVILTAIPRLVATNPVPGTSVSLGVITAILSGVAFALYLIAMQISFRKMHPVPVSVIQFFTIFFLASLSLLLPIGPKVAPGGLIGFILGGIVLGTLTLVGYLLNNFGVRFMGAARASIVASSGPVLTALLAFLITGSALQGVQWLGILIVTFGVVALSFERMLIQNRAAAKAAK